MIHVEEWGCLVARGRVGLSRRGECHACKGPLWFRIRREPLVVQKRLWGRPVVGIYDQAALDEACHGSDVAESWITGNMRMLAQASLDVLEYQTWGIWQVSCRRIMHMRSRNFRAITATRALTIRSEIFVDLEAAGAKLGGECIGAFELSNLPQQVPVLILAKVRLRLVLPAFDITKKSSTSDKSVRINGR
jgi:hypothetical protein